MSEHSRKQIVAAAVMSAFAVLIFAAVAVFSSRAANDWLDQHGIVSRTDADTSGQPPYEATARNRFWTVMNLGCGDPPDETLEFERMVCVALRPASDDEARGFALLTLLERGALDFEPQELNHLVRVFREASAEARISTLRSLAADSEYGMTVAELTADPERLRQFINGEQITLE